MSLYRAIQRLGIPDSNIILMLSVDHACNPRNPFKAHLYSNATHDVNVYGDHVEVDYRGYEVTVENFLSVLTGRHDPAVPRSKRLLSDEGSNILIFLTGHGGNEFIKFQDVTELMAQDLADALAQMHEKRRYKQVLIVVETCEAFTLVSRIQAPNVIAVGSSLKDESSLSHVNDFLVGQPLTDRFTHLTLKYAEGMQLDSPNTLADLFKQYDHAMMGSHYAHRTTAGVDRPVSDIRMTEFFGTVVSAHSLHQVHPLRKPPPRDQAGKQSQAPEDNTKNNESLSEMAAAQQQGGTDGATASCMRCSSTSQSASQKPSDNKSDLNLQQQFAVACLHSSRQFLNHDRTSLLVAGSIALVLLVSLHQGSKHRQHNY